ncbi:MAG: hypothetical protein HC814_06840 [Rhodobacteraceae bacterium]|nr:hypothetical protein [Paracoccaceae bacterium]
MQRTSTKSTSSNPNPFTELRARFDEWRQSRRPGQRIPKDLWKEAATLARLQGLSPTCTALQLNYYDLQRRMGKPRHTRKARVVAPTFVPLAPVAPSPLLDPDTLEITKPYGARLTFKMPRAKARDLLLWINSFLRS